MSRLWAMDLMIEQAKTLEFKSLENKW